MARTSLSAAVVMVTLAALAACAGTRTQQSTGENIDDTVITAKVKAALIDDPVTKARQIRWIPFAARCS